MSDPRRPDGGWTDPYEELMGLTGDEPLPQLEDPTTPPAQPPPSPLLTGLVIGLLLVALSVAVFQLLAPEGDGAAAGGTTVASVPDDGAPGTTTPATPTTTPGEGTPTTEAPPAAAPYPPIEPKIPVEKLKLKTDGIRIQDDDIPDLDFGIDAATAIGRLSASLGDPDEDTNWQVSTGRWGVCEGELERIIRYGPFHAIVTRSGGRDVFNGYRQDITVGDFESPAKDLETLSGLKAGDTVERLEEIYRDQNVEFATRPPYETVFELRSARSGDLLLWGPVRGTDPEDLVLGIFAPDVCDR